MLKYYDASYHLCSSPNLFIVGFGIAETAEGKFRTGRRNGKCTSNIQLIVQLDFDE